MSHEEHKHIEKDGKEDSGNHMDRHHEHGKHLKHNMKHGYQGGHNHHEHHAHMVQDFKRRFRVSLVITVPVLLLLPLIQNLLNIQDIVGFRGDSYVLFAPHPSSSFMGHSPF